MKHLNTNPRYSEAAAVLAELVQAERMAATEESHLQGLLSVPETPERADPLAAAVALVRGTVSPKRENLDNVALQLRDVQARLVVLRGGIERQRVVLAALVSELSAAACVQAMPAHDKATQGVYAALLALRAAFVDVAAVRDELAGNGYRVSLDTVVRPEFNFSDPCSAASQLLKDLETAQQVRQLAESAHASVRLLVDCEQGLSGDVVKVDGTQAAHLVRIGRGEATSAKPHRVQRLKPWEYAEVVLS